MWTRSLACCIALLTLVALPVLGVVPPVVQPAMEIAPHAVRGPGPCSDEHWLAVVSTPPSAAVAPTADPPPPTEPPPPPTCPHVDGWTTSPLFAGLRFNGPLFCRYDKTGGGATPLTTVIGLSAVVRLCSVVLPLPSGTGASVVDPKLSELLYRELRFQVGATELPLDPSKPPGVRLAVIDTQPTGIGVPAAPPASGQGSPHGFNIGAIARDLTCDRGCGLLDLKRGPCAAEITTRLALNMSGAGDPPTTDETRGGYFGRPSDVALAIVREVDAWLDARQRQPQSEPLHLIENLSLGWDSDLLHGLTGSPNAEEIAVYAALDYARKKGALPIAASGNSPGGSKPGSGATAPASWFAAPLETQGLFTAQDPVVWAVGAVDRDDRPLANVRAHSLPPLVAYGDHAVVLLPSGQWTEPMTGSSVSAVVASSIAAVSWHLRDDLGAEDIMMLLGRSASQLPRQADIYLSSSDLGLRQASTSAGNGIQQPPSIRRLWFHSALSRAWSRPQLHDIESSWATNAPQKVDCSTAHQMSNCGSPTWVCTDSAWSSSMSSIPCPQSPPSLESISSVPWVVTQPGQDACPTCAISSGIPPGSGIKIKVPTVGVEDATSQMQMRVAQPSGAQVAQGGTTPTDPTQAVQQPWRLELAIPSDWAAGNQSCLTSLLLEVTTPGSSQANRVLIVPSTGPLCAGHSLLVDNLPFDPGQGTATITFQIQGMNKLIRSPLYVGWQP